LTLRVIGDAFSLRTVIGTSASAANRLSGTSFIGIPARGKTTLSSRDALFLARKMPSVLD